jgi:MFS transporter
VTTAGTQRTRDRALLYSAAFLRASATQYVGIVLGLLLAATKWPAWITSAGLAGGAAAAAVVTLAGARLPPRTTVFAVALLTAAGAVAVAFASGPWIAAAAAFVGMLNAMGRDRGAALAVESALLPSTTDDAGRTSAFAWHGVFQDAGHALGALLVGAAAPVAVWAAGAAAVGAGDAAPSRGGLLVAAGLALVAAAPYGFLSHGLAAAPRAARAPVSPESRRILTRVCALFALDGFGGGFLSSALLTWFFFDRFHVDERTIGPLFAAANVFTAFSHLGAAWLARRIGLVRTMVFTHIPSSLLLMTVPWAPSFGVAAALFLARNAIVEMDVPTRQSYVMAVVRPEERTAASGATLLVRLFAYVTAPLVLGTLPFGAGSAAPLLLGGGTKILYDVLLWRSFRALKPPEERSSR